MPKLRKDDTKSLPKEYRILDTISNCYKIYLGNSGCISTLYNPSERQFYISVNFFGRVQNNKRKDELRLDKDFDEINRIRDIKADRKEEKIQLENFSKNLETINFRTIKLEEIITTKKITEVLRNNSELLKTMKSYSKGFVKNILSSAEKFAMLFGEALKLANELNFNDFKWVGSGLDYRNNSLEQLAEQRYDIENKLQEYFTNFHETFKTKSVTSNQIRNLKIVISNFIDIDNVNIINYMHHDNQKVKFKNNLPFFIYNYLKSLGEEELNQYISNAKEDYKRILKFIYYSFSCLTIINNDNKVELDLSFLIGNVETPERWGAAILEAAKQFKKLTEDSNKAESIQVFREIIDIVKLQKFLNFETKYGEGYSNVLLKEMQKSFLNGNIKVAHYDFNMHAELNSLSHIYNKFGLDGSELYIGVSKLCCSDCYNIINTTNKLTSTDFIVRGTHGKDQLTSMPNFFRNYPEEMQEIFMKKGASVEAKGGHYEANEERDFSDSDVELDLVGENEPLIQGDFDAE